MMALGAAMLFPVCLMVAAGLWMAGYDDVGDGFSAGVVAALGAVAQYLARPPEQAARWVGAGLAWRLAVGGLLVVLILVLAPIWLGVPPVTHLPAPGEHVVEIGALKLHTAQLMDLGIAATVYGLVVGTFDLMFRSDPA